MTNISIRGNKFSWDYNLSQIDYSPDVIPFVLIDEEDSLRNDHKMTPNLEWEVIRSFRRFSNDYMGLLAKYQQQKRFNNDFVGLLGRYQQRPYK